MAFRLSIHTNPRTMPGAWPSTPPDSPIINDFRATTHSNCDDPPYATESRLDIPQKSNKSSIWYEIFGSLKVSSREASKVPEKKTTKAVESQLPTPPPSREGSINVSQLSRTPSWRRDSKISQRTHNRSTSRDYRVDIRRLRRGSDASDTSSGPSIDLNDFDSRNDPRFRVSDFGEEWKRSKRRSPVQEPLRTLPLSWESKVKQAVKLGYGQFSNDTIRRILPSGNGPMSEGWLNDDAVNEYLNLIAKHYNQSHGCQPGKPPACHSFGSFFMSSLKSRGPAKMSSWARRAKLDGERLLEADLIFFPICDHMHWTLMVLSPKERSVRYYDSMGGAGATYTLRLKEFLESHLGKAFSADDWQFDKSHRGCPQQNNAIDCGVFATLAAKYLSLNLDLSYSAQDIPLQRKIMVGELIKGGLFGAAPLDDGF